VSRCKPFGALSWED